MQSCLCRGCFAPGLDEGHDEVQHIVDVCRYVDVCRLLLRDATANRRRETFVATPAACQRSMFLLQRHLPPRALARAAVLPVQCVPVQCVLVLIGAIYRANDVWFSAGEIINLRNMINMARILPPRIHEQTRIRVLDSHSRTRLAFTYVRRLVLDAAGGALRFKVKDFPPLPVDETQQSDASQPTFCCACSRSQLHPPPLPPCSRQTSGELAAPIPSIKCLALHPPQ